MKVRGRPCKDEGRSKVISLRLSMDEASKLVYLSEKTGMSVSDILRNGIRLQYNIHK